MRRTSHALDRHADPKPPKCLRPQCRLTTLAAMSGCAMPAQRAVDRAEHRRCRWHGERSTGPRTPEGKRRSAANLIRAREVLARKRRAVPRST